MTADGRVPEPTTGLPGLDRVLRGIEPGDNIVWSVDGTEDFRRLVEPYVQAATDAGRRVVYFRFGPEDALVDAEEEGVERIALDARVGFERFVRELHRWIESRGPGTVYVFDPISSLAEIWMSDQALGNFFVLTCPRLRDLQTVTYFAIERDQHSIHAVGPIRDTTQFFLDAFTQDGRFYVRPVKVQYRSQEAMDTLHVQEGGEFVAVEESATLAGILSTTRWPRLMRNRRSGYWDRMYQEMDRALDEKAAGRLLPEAEADLLARVRYAFRVHRSGVAPLAEKWFGLEDFQSIRQRMIGVGSVGGKALGMLVARAILRGKAPDFAERLEVHDSFFVGAEVFVTFLVRNGVWWIREAQKAQEGFLQGLEEGRRKILRGEFPSDILLQFEGMLDYFGERPCIVRSSSILEDAMGNAFSGKYESVFLANRGSREERLAALLDAVRRVYASVLDPEALHYRKERDLLQSEERMALLIMRVSGRCRGKYFFPQGAGVGLSYNPWSWHSDINPEDGLLRLVFGLGTRAVDRADDDYTRLVSLSAPLRRPESSLDEQHDHSQRRMDLIDLDARQLVSKEVAEIVPLCGDFPVGLFVEDEGDGMPWVTFGPLLQRREVIGDLRRMLAVLAEEYDSPVDIEFTLNFLEGGRHCIHLLQCRTFQVQKHQPVDGSKAEAAGGPRVIEARGAVIGLGRRVAIHDMIYVPTAGYAELTERRRIAVGRLIESLVQAHDARRNLLLVGPGRWGTSSPSLGIPVRSGRIARACAVCEVVAMHSGLVPDVSLGTHFFNDLVEHDLLYLACFPGKPGNTMDEAWLLEAKTRELPGAQDLPVRWIDLAESSAMLVADPVQGIAILEVC